MTLEDGLSLSGRAEKIEGFDEVSSLSGSVEVMSDGAVEDDACAVLGLSLSGRIDDLSSMDVVLSLSLSGKSVVLSLSGTWIKIDVDELSSLSPSLVARKSRKSLDGIDWTEVTVGKGLARALESLSLSSITVNSSDPD